MTVTIPDFDYAAMYRREPVAWRESGLHWHAYAWRGTGREWADDAARATDSTDITPTAVRAWLRRPARQIRGTFSTPEDAGEWVMQQWQQARGDALTPVPEWIVDEERHAAVLYALRCGNDVSHAVWVRGPSMFSFAMVGTSEGCH